MTIGTLGHLYITLGTNFVFVLLDRVAKNFDIAIYASQIYDRLSPPHGILFYAVLPILTKIDRGLYSLEYYKIPQWVLDNALGISRFGRSGAPNDNLIVGLLVSYSGFGVFLFLSFLFIVYRYILYLSLLRKVSAFHLYLLLNIMLFFSSTQDFMIKILVVAPIFLTTTIITYILPHKLFLKKFSALKSQRLHQSTRVAATYNH